MAYARREKMMDGGLVRLVACVVGTLAVVGLRASMRKSPKNLVLDLAEGRPMSPEGEETPYCADPMAGPVLRGVDVVAYRSLRPLEKAVMGEARFQARHGSYNFYFRSSSNRNLFVDDPVRYAPKFGGFCSYGICDESMWTSSTLGPLANPNVWAIIDDRLYVYMYCTPEHKFFSGNVSAPDQTGRRTMAQLVPRRACLQHAVLLGFQKHRRTRGSRQARVRLLKVSAAARRHVS